MGIDKEKPSWSRRLIVPFLAIALLFSIAHVIIRPASPILLLAYALFMLAALISALVAHKASMKHWGLALVTIIVVALVTGTISYALQ
ncbi:MAG: hypothetical protein IKZ87_05620 [Actinomycetaceae bacterium]|nr:hypothetical protein [Actinomycetaceae bacterium]